MRGLIPFPKGIRPKVNLIARLEYELAYFTFALHRFYHYTMRTPTLCVIVSVSVSQTYNKPRSPFENKMRHMYFYKEVFRFFEWCSFIIFDYDLRWVFEKYTTFRHPDDYHLLIYYPFFFLLIQNLYRWQHYVYKYNENQNELWTPLVYIYPTPPPRVRCYIPTSRLVT